MLEHTFTVEASFEAVVAALQGLGTVAVHQMNEGHALATLASGGALIARFVDPQHVEVTVAELHSDLVAREIAATLKARLGCAVTEPKPLRDS